MASFHETKLGAIEAVAASTHNHREPNYMRRSQWLRAAILGATDGLVSTASLILGVGAVKNDVKAMAVSGLAGLVAGACSMAIGEFVSVHSQLDVELADIRRKVEDGSVEATREVLPNPMQAAAASALAFSMGAAVPLLAAGFVSSYRVRIGLVAAVVTAALTVFGWAGASLGRAAVGRACLRVVVGGWVAMAMTFGLMKVVGYHAL